MSLAAVIFSDSTCAPTQTIFRVQRVHSLTVAALFAEPVPETVILRSDDWETIFPALLYSRLYRLMAF
jgi:hypothetical protein